MNGRPLLVRVTAASLMLHGMALGALVIFTPASTPALLPGRTEGITSVPIQLWSGGLRRPLTAVALRSRLRRRIAPAPHPVGAVEVERPSKPLAQAPLATPSGASAAPGSGTRPATKEGQGFRIELPRSEQGPELGLMALLQMRLAQAALRCYPPEAARFRLHGKASLAFCLSGGGEPSGVRVAQSSGSSLLDHAAVDCILPGAEPLPRRAGCYTVPVVFVRPN